MIPGPDEHCEAIVELLEPRPEGFHEADEVCRSAVAALFPGIQGGLQGGQPERRTGRVLKSKSLGCRRSTFIVRRQEGGW